MKDKKTFREIVKSFGEKLFNGMKRYPAAIGMAAAASVIGVVVIHNEQFSDETLRFLAACIMALVLGVLLSLVIKTIMENNKMIFKIKSFSWIVLGCGLVLYSLFLYRMLEILEDFEFMRFAALLLAAFVLFMTAVFRRNTKYQEVFSTQVGWRLAITFIYTMIIWGGISLILFAIEELLGVKIDEEVYFDVIVIAAGFFAPMFFLGGVPENEDELTPEKIYKFFRILVLYVIAPLLTAYSVVFYLYVIRIIFNWNWPDGMVGNMVLWYALIGTVTMYFLHGMDTDSRWGKIFGRWFPRIVILPLVLLFISLGIRLNAYGFTPVRYLLGATGIWMLLCAVYMSVVNYQKRNTRIITISLAVIATISMVGPWSALNIGRVSQINRLEKILESNNMLVNGEVVPNTDVSREDMIEISSKVDYLTYEYGLKGVDFLPEDFETKDMKQVFGFDYLHYYEEIAKPGEMNDIHIRSDMTEGIINIKGYDYVWNSDRWESYINTEKGRLFMNFDRKESGSFIIVELDSEKILNKDIEPFLHEIRRKWESSGGMIGTDDLTFEFSTDTVDYRLVFTDVELYDLDPNGFVIGWIRFTLMTRFK